MILSESFDPEWIKIKREQYPKSDPTIMEKVIYALYLVEELGKSELKFTFKGGTSLLLILPEPKRFSIDIDIVSLDSREKIEAILAEICTKGIFSKFELDEPRSYKEGIPKAHYLLTFHSKWEDKERVILLDILFEDHGYPAIVQAPILNEWIKTDGEEVKVSIPSVNSITGDKLTAYGPNTIGIRYGRNKQMEIIKQLFDIGILFDRIDNIEDLRKSFDKTSEKEIGYRPKDEGITRESVLSDIIDTSLMIASMGKFFSKEENYKEITDGLNQMKSFIYNGAFRIDEAIVASSKASYLAAIILTGYQGELLRWEGDDITKYSIANQEYNFLNKRRNIPGGSLFYWYQTLKLLGKLE